MGLLLPTRNLPKGCGDCLLCEDGYYYYCKANPKLLIDSGNKYIRHKDCPLIEVDIPIE